MKTHFNFTPYQRKRLREAAQHVLDARAAGKLCSQESIEWAEWVLRMNFAQVPYDDDLPEHMLPGRERA